MKIPLLLLSHCYFVISSNPLVELPGLGKIEGTLGTSLNGRVFNAFEGVPYAAPPIGNQRFEEASLVLPWVDTFKANTIHKCMQYNEYFIPGEQHVIGDEDCLYLNIYTPSIESTTNLDVIVFIHGGAFMYNWGGLYGPKYLLNKNVVVITLNYRLGPLGFLSTEDNVVAGNMGVKDQILALKFIQTYVKYFGGNPNSVTIMGMSAGGASVHFHYLSQKSRGLFTRGFSQSGTTLNPWVLQEAALEKAKQLASICGCSTKKIDHMILCLKTRPAIQIVGAVKQFQVYTYTPFSPFGLVIDSWSTDPVLPQHPYLLLKQGLVFDAPYIASWTSSEGLYPLAAFYANEKHLKKLDEEWKILSPHFLDYNYTASVLNHDIIGSKVRQYYLGNKTISKESFKSLIPVVTNRMFVLGIQQTVLLQSALSRSPIYSYNFSYRGTHSYSEMRGGTTENFGASHGDDTAYVFNIAKFDTSGTAKDRQMIEFFVNLLTAFAKNGTPAVGIEWPPLEANQMNFLAIKGPVELSVGHGLVPDTDFWESLPILEKEKLFKDEL